LEAAAAEAERQRGAAAAASRAALNRQRVELRAADYQRKQVGW
jgi:hypothetical protein